MKKFSIWKRYNRRWLTIGMGVKRWLLLLAVGTAVAGIGLVNVFFIADQQGWLPKALLNFLTFQYLPPFLRVLLPILIGGICVGVAVEKLGRRLLAPFPDPGGGVAEMLYTYSQRGRGPNIVAIGGGTGMPALLRGLRQYTDNITAIVTVADDGGSSGRLRKELGLLPPGDFRNNIAALSRDEALMTQVLQYRFGSGTGENGRSELQGHAFGNLLLAALTGITGSFDEALLAAERVLALRGRVLPSTLANVDLAADIKMEDGTIQRVVGESSIPKAHGAIEKLYLQPEFVRAYPPAVKALLQADLIVMGPGSLYTSILPNLIVPDITKALQRTRAKRVYVCNLATQPGETDDYTVADHVATILHHIPADCLDIVLANDNLSIPPDQGGGQTVFVQPIAPQDVQMKTADLVDRDRPWRHDSAKVAQVVVDLLR